MIPTHNVPVTNYPAVCNVDFNFEILLIFKLPHVMIPINLRLITCNQLSPVH